jgi:hypothetical protein
MATIDKILRFAAIFLEKGSIEKIPNFDDIPELSGLDLEPIKEPTKKISPNTSGYTRVTTTPSKEIQDISSKILNENRAKPLGTSIPFESNGISYMAVIEEHAPGPRNPKPHPGVSLFIKSSDKDKKPETKSILPGIPRFSQRTISKLQELKPEFRTKVEQLMKQGLEKGLRPEIVEAKRSQTRQEELYEQGRTKPGKIVTWTRSSMHTKGLAVDIAQLDEKGNITYNAKPGFWEEMGRIAKSLGISWGGNFPSPDRPHFQYKK